MLSPKGNLYVAPKIGRVIRKSVKAMGGRWPRLKHFLDLTEKLDM